jgi:uncharacterized SAM-binding protein YcdF (DUF218 family)
VIDLIVDFLKQFARPSSVTFLVVLLTAGVVLVFVRRTQRYARWYFAAVLAFYWIGTSPMFIERLISWQGGEYRPIAAAAEARGARTVVVLGAGNYTIRSRSLWLNELPVVAALRVIEGARLYALLDHPTVIVSGGITGRNEGARPEAEAMRIALVQLGVPADDIQVETESMNTRDEAAIVARMLAGQARQPIVLVTSPTHMKRSLAVFRRAGLDAIPSAAAFKPDHTNERLRWMPSDTGLWLLDTAVYDFAATAYYSLRGWTAGD